MGRNGLIRDYENTTLPIEKRVASLARRFPCLKGAPGLDPMTPSEFYKWLRTVPKGSAARHAGLLILNLLGKGEWPPFDAISALSVFDDADKMVFGNWVRCWHAPKPGRSIKGVSECLEFSPPLT